MAPPFKQMQPREFVQSVSRFAWSPQKSSIHMHHTWRPNHSQYTGLRSIQAMYDYHVNTNGWSDIAQHISIAPDGTIWTGRPWNKSPASATGFNSSKVFMFETIGDFDNGRDPLGDAQLDAVIMVIASLMQRFDLGNSALKFHNEMSTKSCPGSSVSKAHILDLVHEARDSLPGEAPGLPDERQEELLSAAGSHATTEQLETVDDGEPPEHDADYERAIERSVRK
jgi:hypothetical protein